MVVPLIRRPLANNPSICRRYTHDAGKMCRESAGFLLGNFAGATLPGNGDVWRDRDGVSVWENVSLLLVHIHVRFEHCVVI